MDLTETYVIRIYRRSDPKSGGVTGTVEWVDDGKVRTFAGFDELRGLLELPQRPHLPAARRQRRTDPGA